MLEVRVSLPPTPSLDCPLVRSAPPHCPPAVGGAAHLRDAAACSQGKVPGLGGLLCGAWRGHPPAGPPPGRPNWWVHPLQPHVGTVACAVVVCGVFAETFLHRLSNESGVKGLACMESMFCLLSAPGVRQVRPMLGITKVSPPPPLPHMHSTVHTLPMCAVPPHSAPACEVQSSLFVLAGAPRGSLSVGHWFVAVSAVLASWSM